MSAHKLGFLSTIKKSWIIGFFMLFVVIGFSGCGGGGGSNTNQQTGSKNIIKKSFTYDSYGQLVSENLGNGNYIKYVYDENGNLISQTVAKD